MSYNSPQKMLKYPRGHGNGLDSDDELANGGAGGGGKAFSALGASSGNLDKMLDDNRYDAVYNNQMLSN
jgi:hypothetical protein